MIIIDFLGFASMSSKEAAKATIGILLVCVLYYILILYFFDIRISVVKGDSIIQFCELTLFVVFFCVFLIIIFRFIHIFCFLSENNFHFTI